MAKIPENWKHRVSKKTDKKIFSKFKYSVILAKILAGRGITTEEEIDAFLNPSLKYLHDPKLLSNIDKGIDRIKNAVSNNENILIFGDYDADGIISSVIAYNFLKKLSLNVDIYIPDRFKDGYDINLSFIKKISKKKYYNVVICVDCGTNSKEVEQFIDSSRSDIDVIVCDHHKPSKIDSSRGKSCREEIKKYIIINPRLQNSNYPFKHLSGAGVTFKFITAVLRELDKGLKKRFKKDYLTKLLDIVAISTIADIMPLVDENRIIVKKGLKLLKETENKGLKKMLETVLSNKQEVDVYDVGFIIAPRLNAAGRIKSAKESLDLLKGDDGVNLEKLVNDLNSFNNKRKNLQKSILEEITDKNDFSHIASKQKIFIDKSKRWNEGVLGIAASNLANKYNIPVILFKEEEGKLKGSGRSIEKFNLYENLFSVRNFFEKFGGHEQACGITMVNSNFECFKEEMLKIAGKKLKKVDVEKKYYYDSKITFKDLKGSLIKEIKLLKPFGFGNPRPAFVTSDCEIMDVNYTRNEKHVRLRLKNKNTVFEAVMFNINENKKKILCLRENVDILYNIIENSWSGRKSDQLVILDIFQQI